jgi:hypothetical protein
MIHAVLNDNSIQLEIATAKHCKHLKALPVVFFKKPFMQEKICGQT